MIVYGVVVDGASGDYVDKIFLDRALAEEYGKTLKEQFQYIEEFEPYDEQFVKIKSAVDYYRLNISLSDDVEQPKFRINIEKLNPALHPEITYIKFSAEQTWKRTVIFHLSMCFTISEYVDSHEQIKQEWENRANALFQRAIEMAHANRTKEEIHQWLYAQVFDSLVNETSLGQE